MTWRSRRGDNLAIQDWPLDPGTRLRGVVLIVHGLGEHIGRYAHVAAHLNAAGWHVTGYDHRGHGRSRRAHTNCPGTSTRGAAADTERGRRQRGVGGIDAAGVVTASNSSAVAVGQQVIVTSYDLGAGQCQHHRVDHRLFA